MQASQLIAGEKGRKGGRKSVKERKKSEGKKVKKKRGRGGGNKREKTNFLELAVILEQRSSQMSFSLKCTHSAMLRYAPSKVCHPEIQQAASPRSSSPCTLFPLL